MNLFFRSLALVTLWAISAVAVAIAGEAVPINTSFGVQWTPVDWSVPTDRITECLGAARLPNGKVLGIATRDHLDAVNGRITSDYVTIVFSATDWVYAQYTNIPAVYYPATNTASFFGPLKVVGGEGRFLGATGDLSVRTSVQFYPLPVATYDIKGVIKTAR
jgi:hypothetical protein